LSMPWSPGEDVARSIAITPDGKGYLILLADGRIMKYGSAATGALGALGQVLWPGNDLGRSIAGMPDGAGYLVLASPGGVNKFGSARKGLVGTGSTPYWGTDLGRDLAIVSGWGIPFGYYVLDAWGGVAATSGLARPANPGATLFFDRWRSIAVTSDSRA